MLQWFQRLMPRQEKFFPLFARHAEVLVAGARALRDMLKSGDTSRRCREVMAQELKADDITREVMVAIRTSFITPFDRADIEESDYVDGRCYRPDAADGKGDSTV